MGTYHIWTIGCQMNRADSEKLASGLRRLGHRPAARIEMADIIVVNSCVVRQSAENRVVSRLRSLEPVKNQRSDTIVALTGCMVDEDTTGLRTRFPCVDLFLRPGQFDELLERAGPGFTWQPEGIAPSPWSPTAFVTIIEGCDNYCSYCIVPYRRGKERSRTKADIRSEVLELARAGVREVTLLGQNVDSYGHDLPDRPDLADLLHELSAVEGLVRIRFLTSHPKDMTGKLIEAVAALDKVCEYISLPVQAGDDDILRAMGRGYSVERYRSLVERIRASIPGARVKRSLAGLFSCSRTSGSIRCTSLPTRRGRGPQRLESSGTTSLGLKRNECCAWLRSFRPKYPPKSMPGCGAGKSTYWLKGKAKGNGKGGPGQGRLCSFRAALIFLDGLCGSR
jgi:tRNA-2-methylthio-N6-dimethylallyladenosine synthase